MTNKEWIDLFQREWNVHRKVAKEMLYYCYMLKKEDNAFKRFLGIKGSETEVTKYAE